MTEEPDNNIAGRNETDAFVEKMKARKETYNRFCDQFEQRSKHQFVIKVHNILNPNDTDTISLYSNIEKPEVLEVNLDRKDPVSFGETKFSPHFKRYAAPPPPDKKPKDDDSDGFRFEFDDEDNPVQKEPEIQVDYSQEGILKDLQKKFEDAGLPDIPVMKYARRLVGERYEIDKTVAKLKANAIVPMYRDLEVKRLVTDPNSQEVSYYEIAKQRQHVYDQLTGLLRESGMDPKEITEYLMHGLFDSNKIAGVPIFGDKNGNRYVVIDYSFSGYDEQNPVGTDFSDGYHPRSYTELNDILDKAEELGYETYFDNSYVSGGTHQRWDWHGIKIPDFDKEHLENNAQKVIDILKAVGVNPLEAANPNEEHINDRFIRQVA